MSATPPSDTDVKNFILAQWPDLDQSALTVILTGCAEAALNEFETRTGRKPFIAEASNSTQPYDAPGPVATQSQGFPLRGGGRLLELRSGYIAIDEVRIGCTFQNTDGTLLEEGRNYWLKPDEAEGDGSPYEWIELATPVFGDPQSVKIVGKRGFTANWPTDAFNAVKELAAADKAPAIAQQLSQGIKRDTDGDASVEYSAPDMLATAKEWRLNAERVINRYRLIQMGLN